MSKGDMMNSQYEIEENSFEESCEHYKKRWTSIRIIYITMFFDSLSFSIILSSLWPYLQKISGKPELNPSYVGWASVSYQVAGIFADFMMGYLTNKRGSIEPLLISLVFFGFGNFLYGYAESCGEYGVGVVILSRGIIGLSTGVNVVGRAVLAKTTTLKERTTAMAHMSVVEGIGFAFGPAIQLISIPLGDRGVYLPNIKLNLNLYTAPAFASIIITFLNIILIVTRYREYHVNIYKDSENDKDVDEYKALLRDCDSDGISFDKRAVFVLLFAHFIAQNAFALYETILPPLIMDMLAWTREETTLWASLIFLGAGLIAISAFIFSNVLENIASERFLLVAGFSVIFLGFAIYLPGGKELPILKESFTNLTFNNNSNIITGCPDDYSWCQTSPKIHISQIIVGTILLSVGYPIVMVFTSSLYSKVLGSNPQGIMQSWFGASGGLARITAPIFITYLYVELGPRWTFSSVDILVLLSIVIILALYKTLIPFHMSVLKRKSYRKESISYNNNETYKQTERNIYGTCLYLQNCNTVKVTSL